MAEPTGVNGITGFVISNPQAPPFEQQGGPVDPAHSHWGQQAQPYPWEVVPLGPYPGSISPLPGIVDDENSNPDALMAGQLGQDPTADQTPAFHAAPYPSEGPQSRSADQLDVHSRAMGSTRQLLDSLRVHASNTGAGLRRLFDFTYGSKQDQWTGFYNPEKGNDTVPKVPGAIGNNAGGFGVNDHTSNPYAKVNAYNFNTSHRHRRFATGPIPGNTMWMKPGGRPMVRTFTGIHQFPTSGAFAGDDTGYTFGYQGAILAETPSEYAAPPQPTLGPAVVSDQTTPAIPFY